MRHPTTPANAPTYHRIAFMLIVIGALFGADAYYNLHVVYKLWPLVVTILGIGFVGIFYRRERRDSGFLTLGLYLIFFSGLALFLNFTTWRDLAQLWPFIGFLGVGLVAGHFLCRRNRWLLLPGLLLISLSAAFFFVFTIDPGFWWSIFVLVGISILIGERARVSDARKPAVPGKV
jgi:hypothetical protein